MSCPMKCRLDMRLLYILYMSYVTVQTLWYKYLTSLSNSHGDVDFQVRTCTYIHMDGICFLVTRMKTKKPNFHQALNLRLPGYV